MEGWQPNPMIHPIHALGLEGGGGGQKRSFRCNLCMQEGSGARYCCSKCKFNFHPFCATYRATVVSPLHPQHELTLVNVNCSICFHPPPITPSEHRTLFYGCKRCRFYVHPSCHCLQTPNFFSKKFPKHVDVSGHILTLSNTVRNYTCHYCHKRGSGNLYACKNVLCNCNVNLHPICEVCPEYLFSPFHKEHNLSLDFHRRDNLSARCSNCKQLFDGAFYFCKECNFYLHPMCCL